MSKHGTSISDKELTVWSEIKRADEAQAYDFTKHGWGAPCTVTYLAREALEMRRILREFIARHEPTTQDPLVLRAVDLLGFNIEPSQPLFPEWPKPSTDSVSTDLHALAAKAVESQKAREGEDIDAWAAKLADSVPTGDEGTRALRSSEDIPERGARCRNCGHYETDHVRAVATYAHCPSCNLGPHWQRVADEDKRPNKAPLQLSAGTVSALLGEEDDDCPNEAIARCSHLPQCTTEEMHQSRMYVPGRGHRSDKAKSGPTFEDGYAAGVEASASVALAWDGWEKDGDHRCADEIRRLVAFTPCDRPYADCSACKGSGDYHGDPCSICVWRRWAEDAAAAGALATPEEIQADRDASRVDYAITLADVRRVLRSKVNAAEQTYDHQRKLGLDEALRVVDDAIKAAEVKS